MMTPRGVVCGLVLGQLQFRQSLRTSLNQTYSTLHAVDPDSSATSGKVLNSYYESVYEGLPHTFLPGVMLLVGSTVLFVTRKAKNA
jgi:hypothetical protein